MLDFKDFKKVKEDKKEVHMMHPKGHTIIIAVKSLPKIQQEALKRLPLSEGGEVKGVHKSYYDDGEGGESKTGALARNIDLGKGRKEMAVEEHHKVLGEMKSMPQPKLKGLAKGGMAHYDGGTPNQPVSQDDMEAPSAPTIPEAQPQAAPDVSNQKFTGNNDVDQAKAYDLYGKALNTYNTNVAATKNGLMQATNGLNEYQAKNPIDADQYRKNMSVPDKISTGIGLFLGGFSVPFGGQNFAQDFLNKQISNNIDAQKQNFEHEKNVWGAYHSLYNDNNVADKLTAVNELDKMQNRIKQAAVAPGMPPEAGPRAAKLLQDTNAQKDQLLNDTAHQVTQKKLGAPPPVAPPPEGGAKLSMWAQSLPAWAKNLIPTGEATASQGPAQPQQPQSNEPPDVGPMPQFQIDEKRLNNSQYLGSLPNPPPNTIQPGESGAANEELAKAKQFNEKIPLIHSNFDTMWKNRSDNNAALQYLSGLGANIGGAHLSLPDMTTWSESSKNYFRAANRVRQELGALVGNGALTNEQASTVMTNLIREGDTPEDYKNILHQVDGNLLSTLQTPVLERRGLIKRPKIAE